MPRNLYVSCYRKHLKLCLASAALLASVLTVSAPAAEFQPVIPLSSLNGSNGFRLDGAAASARSGSSVSSAGDVNGDGFDDVIIAAVDSASSYVVFGKASSFGSVVSFSSLNGSNGFRLDGGASSVSSAGDVNGDGFDDVIIGNVFAPHNHNASGSSYVVFGKASGFAPVITLFSLNGSDGFRLDGAGDDDFSGSSVSTAGDINGDGFGDVIVGAFRAHPHGTFSGSSYVVFGKAAGFSPAINFSTLNGNNGFRLDGEKTNDISGTSVASAGDVNGDGFDDVIVGAPGADPNGNYSGSSYIVFGKAAAFAPALNLSSLNGSTGFRLDGVAADDRSGKSVSAVGDVNGDGFDDVIVSAAGADPHGNSSGSSYVVFGSAAGFDPAIDLSSLNGNNGFRLDGAASADLSGYSVSSAGDVNSDGFDDIIVGALTADPNGVSSGSSYIVFGKAAGFIAAINLSSLDGSTGFRLDGAAAYDYSGTSVSAAGDINGDGLDDVVVGAYGTDTHGTESGSSYVVFGRAPDRPVTRVGAASDQYISGGAFADTLSARNGGDRVEGRGGGDLLRGGPGSDTVIYRHAPRGVVASLAAPGINSGHAAGDSYISIENLAGSQFADRLTGNNLANTLTGLGGADRITGGLGSDLFVLIETGDSKPGAARDVITDFNAGTAITVVDRIGLGHLDANTSLGGNQAFTFIGALAFSHVKGQLRVSLSGTTTIVSGDVNGDAIADFEIGLLNFTNLANLKANDFVR